MGRPAAAGAAARAAVPLAFAEPFLVLHALRRVELRLGRLDRLLKIRAHLALQRLGLFVVLLVDLLEAGLLIGAQQRLDLVVALAAKVVAALLVLLAATVGSLGPDLPQRVFLIRAEVEQRVELA